MIKKKQFYLVRVLAWESLAWGLLAKESFPVGWEVTFPDFDSEKSKLPIAPKTHFNRMDSLSLASGF